MSEPCNNREHPRTAEEMMMAAGPIERAMMPHIVKVTQAAAIAAAHEMGRGDKMYADHVSVEAMRRVLNTLDITGTVRIGEGERDEAPMLFIGEVVGTGKGDIEVDIAVDPLEGTNLTADGAPGSIAVIAMSEKGGLLNAPDIYIDKIVVGQDVVKYEREHPDEHIDLDAPVAHNLEIVARALNRDINEIVVVILDRPRHKEMIEQIRRTGARARLVTDGDLMPGIATAIRGSGVHVVMGSGGSGEAVLTAAAIKILGGKVLGRLVLPSVANNKSKEECDKEWRENKDRLESMGITKTNINDVMDTKKLAPGCDIVFAASGITPGFFLNEVKLFGGGDARVNSIVMGSSGVVQFKDTIYIKNMEENPLRMA